MDVRIDSLIPFDSLKTNIDHVFSVVEKNGKVVLLKDNKPVYIILKYDENNLTDAGIGMSEMLNYKLHEAMRIVLSEAENKTMHAAELADEIYKRRLYLKKDGSKAEYTQIRARCGHYPDMFEALPGNFIKLKEHYKK
jgi:antitoxin Phd